MKSWKEQRQEMEHYLSLYKEINFERMDKMEEKLESVCHRVLGLEILVSEIRRRNSEPEMVCNKPKDIDATKEEQVN